MLIFENTMEIMMKKHRLGLLTALLFGVYQNAMALNITFDYTYDDNGFFDAAERRTVLEKAGEYWSSRISDNLTAAVSDTPRVRSYDVDIRHPSTGELGFTDDNLRNFSVQQNEYKIFVGTRDLNPNNSDRPTLGVSETSFRFANSSIFRSVSKCNGLKYYV